MSLSGITLGAGISISSGIVLGQGTPSIVSPTVTMNNRWEFDPSYVGSSLSLYNVSGITNGEVAADNPESSTVIGKITYAGGGLSLADYATKSMFSIYHNTEDPADVPLMLASIGIANHNQNLDNPVGSSGNNSNDSIGLRQDGTIMYNGNPYTTMYLTFGPGDYIDVAVDTATPQIWFRVNGGNWNNNSSANPSTGTGGQSIPFAIDGTAGSGTDYYPAVNPGAENYIDAMDISLYTYDIPSGFTTL